MLHNDCLKVLTLATSTDHHPYNTNPKKKSY